MQTHLSTKQFVLYTLLGTAILLVSGPLAINMKGYTPITLQSLAIITVPLVLGMWPGVLSILLYLVLGGFGLPVFADFSGGWAHFSGITNGFLFAFLPAGFLAGWWGNRVKPQFGRFFLIFLVCQLVILLFGLFGFWLHNMPSGQIFSQAKYLFPGLFIKSFIGGFLALAGRAGTQTNA